MLTIRKGSWTILAVRSITLFLEILAVLTWGHPFCKALLKILVIVCAVSVAYEVNLVRSIFNGKAESEDERDQMLMRKAGDKALSYSQVWLSVLLLAFVGAALLGITKIEAGIMLALMAISLPPLLKHSLFLYYEANDEGEYYE